MAQAFKCYNQRVQDCSTVSCVGVASVRVSAVQQQPFLGAPRARAWTLLSYSRLHSVYMRAASEFAGEFGFGSHSNDWIDVSTADTS